MLCNRFFNKVNRQPQKGAPKLAPQCCMQTLGPRKSNIGGMITSAIIIILVTLLLIKLGEWMFQTWQQCREVNTDVFPTERHRWPILVSLQQLFGKPGELIARHVIRPGRLMILLTAVLMCASAARSGNWKPTPWAAGIAGACIIIHVWVAIGCSLEVILTHSFADLHLRDRYFRLMEKRYPPETARESSSRPKRIRSLFGFLRDMMSIVVIGHAGVYIALQYCAPEAGKLEHVSSRALGIEALYFSVVTAATVGYGDIFPAQGAWLAQSTVISEICASFTLVTLALSCASLGIDERV